MVEGGGGGLYLMGSGVYSIGRDSAGGVVHSGY